MKQYNYKKVIGFTEQQRQAFVILEDHGVNINKFIRQAIEAGNKAYTFDSFLRITRALGIDFKL